MTERSDYFEKRYYITPLGSAKYAQVDPASAALTHAGIIMIVAESGSDGITLHELEHLAGEPASYLKPTLTKAIENGYVQEAKQ